MASRTETASVDWRAVDRELANVPEEYKDPKFYALKHVVEILTSNNPQSMVSQVRSTLGYPCILCFRDGNAMMLDTFVFAAARSRAAAGHASGYSCSRVPQWLCQVYPKLLADTAALRGFQRTGWQLHEVYNHYCC